MPKEITTTQLYRVLSTLTNYGDLSIEDLSEITGYPLPSLRRTISDLKRVGKIKKRIVYGLK